MMYTDSMINEEFFLKGNDYVSQSILTLDEINSKLSGLHFAKEALTDGEQQILYMAEALLRHVHNINDIVKQQNKDAK